ncbi:MAG: sigma-54 dependent transcriptional regulator [Bryobacteraceae bacterium]
MSHTPDLQNFLGIEAVVVSPAMREVLQLAQRVAQTQASVLITGESGSGKEVVARAIHHYSLRASKPWVDINCGALPDNLVESELFGYEKGAFSGADTTKPGLFEMADKGTLFLDEIGELDPKMQVKLLRVLDRVPYYRLGGSKKIQVDVRIVAATNRDLTESIRDGRFRGDLYHRLGQVRIQIPPLRQRVEDIVPLARFFLKQQDPTMAITPEAEDRMLAHGWPGNIRELRNVIVSTAVMAMHKNIGAADLAIEQYDLTPVVSPAPAAAAAPITTNLDELERQAIMRALEQTGRHHERAASLLGISSRTLSRKLKSYGLAGLRGGRNESFVTEATQ